MKRCLAVLCVAVGMCAATMVNAQDEEKGGEKGRDRGERGERPRFDMGQMFKMMDRNGDGKFTSEEAAEAARERFQQMAKRMDKDGDGSISQDEFQASNPFVGGGGSGEGGGPTPERMLQRMDQNKDGKVSKDEAPEWLQRGFEKLDANSDGSLEASELKGGVDRLRDRLGERRPEGRDRPRPDSKEDRPADDKKE